MKKINVAILSQSKLTPAVEHKPQRIRTVLKCKSQPLNERLARINIMLSEIKRKLAQNQTL